MTFLERLEFVTKTLTGKLDLRPGGRGLELLSGVLPLRNGPPPNRGVAAQLAGYSTMPWVRAVSARVGFSIGSTTWRLYANKGLPKEGQPARRDLRMRRTKSGTSMFTDLEPAILRKDIQFAGLKHRKALLGQIHDKDELTEITDHPMLDLLNNGNAVHSGLELRKMGSINRDLVGECFWLKERAPAKRGIPVAIWPIPPHWIMSTPVPGNDTFRVSFRSWQGEIPATEIMWFKDSDPVMPYWRGSGTAQSLADEMETDEYTAKYMKQFFYNQARPDVIITPKGEQNAFGPHETDRLEQAWTQQHAGFWRAFKPLFSNRPLEITAFPHNFQHLQMSDLRKNTRDICLQVWGVPPEILGIIENSNRSTIDAADFLYSTWVLVPRLEAWRIDFQRLLVPEYDERLILDYESPVQEDVEFKAKIMAAHEWAFEADEIREAAGLSPIEDEMGGFHMQPSGLTYRPDWEEPEPEPMLAPGGFGATPGKPKPKPKPVAAKMEAAFEKLTDDQLLELALQMGQE
jgi:phage portal protein BeeE